MQPELYQLHERLEDTYWWFVAKNNILLHLIERIAKPGARVADIGCGTGGLLAQLATKYDAIGVEMDATARDACARRGLRVLEGHLPDAIPLPDASFDLVVSSEVVEHVEDDRGAVARLASLLAPGGTLVITVPAHQWMWSEHDVANHHFRRYTRAQVRGLIEGTGLEVSLLTYQMVALFPLMAAARFAAKMRGGGNVAAGAEIKPLPRAVNGVLRRVFEAEKWVTPRVPSPIGGSVLCVARRSGG
jgi:SAM-dependent methyltransferase